jgi:phosphoribosylformylglycinamidine cyclo-ligase
MSQTGYAAAGVDIQAANQATTLMTDAVRSTYTSAVLAGIGAFGGCFDLSKAQLGLTGGPVLVASTDGVGTKTLVAAALNRYDTIGQDLVNHCINDILVQGARPLFFLDYIAVARLDPTQVAAIVTGVAQACRASGCVLLGGETAEMPGVYREGAFDLAGTIVGAVAAEDLLPHNVSLGDQILALPSTGLHTNGYSLARRVLADAYAEQPPELGGETIGTALLAVHRCYLREIEALWTAQIPIHALAHITGGGVFDNLPRVLPAGLGAQIRRGSWAIPPIFDLLLRRGQLSEHDAFHALNMGLGMLILVPASASQQVLSLLPEARLVGEVVAGSGVALVNGDGEEV